MSSTRVKLLFGLAFAVIATVSADGSGGLRIDVMDLRNDHGAVYCELFRDAKGFPKNAKKAADVVRAEINEHAALCEFRNLAPGTYAVGAYHDENGNGQLDRGFMGIPKEGVGVSNDVQVSRGSPSFARAKFTVGAEQKQIVIHIKYLTGRPKSYGL